MYDTGAEHGTGWLLGNSLEGKMSRTEEFVATDARPRPIGRDHVICVKREDFELLWRGPFEALNAVKVKDLGPRVGKECFALSAVPKNHASVYERNGVVHLAYQNW